MYHGRICCSCSCPSNCVINALFLLSNTLLKTSNNLALSTHLPLLYANEEMKEPNENQEVPYRSIDPSGFLLILKTLLQSIIFTPLRGGTSRHIWFF
jgi:hypothetical protein